MIEKLVVNGCSYVKVYSEGNGHIDLANKLGIATAETIALGGSSNSRIIRTTLKHSYSNPTPTLYVLGMTFFSRWELPIKQSKTEFEGHWINPQACSPNTLFLGRWTAESTESFKDLMVDAYAHGFEDSLEDLMYRLIALEADLLQRGHRLIVFNQVEPDVKKYIGLDKFSLLSHKCFVDRFGWIANFWQHEKGVLETNYDIGTILPQPRFRHRRPGEHSLVNQYLTNYIVDNKILE